LSLGHSRSQDVEEPVTHEDLRELVGAIARLQEQQRTVHESFLQTLKEIAGSVKSLHERLELVEDEVRRLSGGERPTRQ
jgi:hypothetical protein